MGEAHASLTTWGQHEREPHKLFIQMSGAPGSGKSTAAKHLQKSIGGLVIDHDIIRSSLLEDEDEPFDKVARRAYHLQWALARDVIKQGLDVIIDSTCNFQEVLDQGCALAEQHNYSYWYVECKTEDINLLNERLRARKPMKSQRPSVDSPPAAARGSRVGEDSRALFKEWIENPCRPKANVVIVDSTSSPEMVRNHILKQISHQPGAQASDK
ncbi:hypothetical protein CCHL11_00811 [Colletotrichum chlorophyti]|uniref:Uncharacterized protein n=1 Tax=Colletotrichum chlorophyti TaxID=708187 RepID=A0A1Q8S5D9_9PEZI|nr:hypothetical protein CCHL11_00811 [Colletotrichum chlorophyti]